MPAPTSPRDAYIHSAFPGSITNVRPMRRATQACDRCRKLKAKCNESRPCSGCQEKNVECIYREPVPKKQDIIQRDIQKELREVRQENKLLHSRVGQLERDLRRVHSMNTADFGSLDYPPVDLVKNERQQPEISPGFARPSAPTLPSIESAHVPRPTDPTESPAAHHDSQEQEEVEEDDSKPIALGESVLPINHTTGAARLLLWGSIRKITGPILMDSRISNEKYAMNQEEKRGLLRTAGRGEGLDLGYGYDKNSMNDNPSPARADDVGFDGSSSPATGPLWCPVGGPNPAPPIFTNRAADDRPRRLGDPDGLLELDSITVMRLVESYMSHMNVMHPILSPKKFEVLVQKWLATVPVAPWKVTSSQAEFRKNPTASASSDSRGSKRKRSPGPQEQQEASAPGLIRTTPARTITTALVMAVLALGMICEYRDKIPDVLPTSDKTSNCSPAIRNGNTLSPFQKSPPVSSQTPGLPSPQAEARVQPHCGRSSLEAGSLGKFTPYVPPRNWDVIPGLAYFHIAMEIVASEIGGNSLEHAHVCILIGLYYGQLARVLESYEYIRLASIKLQTLLRPRLEHFRNLLPLDVDTVAKDEMENGSQSVRGQAIKVSSTDNEFLFAFWTILQLESDITAELPCVHSGILQYEGLMPYPDYHVAVSGGMKEYVYRSYIDQLYMRKHLNLLHGELYKPRESSKSQSSNNGAASDRAIDVLQDSSSTFEASSVRHQGQPSLNEVRPSIQNVHTGFDRAVEALEESLSSFQSICGALLGHEGSPPANDILTARLRAKFYGAQVITYRPYVEQILELSSLSSVPLDRSAGAPYAIEMSSFVDGQVFIQTSRFHKHLQYAKRGIRALINSTRAFHGLGGGRLIVTNVWGTAHAQWGNLLVLQAAYCNPLLNHLIDGKELQFLLTKTLEFLNMHAQPSSSLALDIKILEYAGRQTGLLPSSSKPKPLAARPNTFFSSS